MRGRCVPKPAPRCGARIRERCEAAFALACRWLTSHVTLVLSAVGRVCRRLDRAGNRFRHARQASVRGGGRPCRSLQGVAPCAMQAFQGAVGYAGEPVLCGGLWRCVAMRCMQSDACMMNIGNSSLGNHGAIQIRGTGVRILDADAGNGVFGPVRTASGFAGLPCRSAASCDSGDVVLGTVFGTHSVALGDRRRADAGQAMQGLARVPRRAWHEEGACTPARAAFTHAWALRSRRPRVIHGVLRASGVCNCCVFFIKLG